MSESTFEEEPQKSTTDDIAKSVAGSSDNGGAGDGSTSNSDDKVVVKADDRAVKASKLAVLFVIVLTAVAFSAVTYVFTNNEETNNFEIQFDDFAYQVSTVAQDEAESVFGILVYHALTISSYCIDTGIEWPFVSIPHFETRGNTNNRFSKALQVSLVPLVRKEVKEEWEEYAWNKQSWVQEGVDLSSILHREYLGPDLTVPAIPSKVFRFQEGTAGGAPVPEDGAGVGYGPADYGVVWQQAPAPHDPSVINFNLLSHPSFARAYKAMWESTKAVLSEVIDLSFLYQGAILDEIEHPHSFLMQPIYSTLADENKTIDDRDSLVGFLVAVLPWDSYFANLLPAHIQGMVVAVYNSCGDSFTYRLNGPEAVYLGEGDLHDSKYSHLGIVSAFSPSGSLNYSSESSVVQDSCDYELRMYPSASFEDSYRSESPWIYALVVLSLFVFTAGVFVIYDWTVQRRNTKVVSKAKQTNAIVSALFPSNVRDRILRDAEEQAKHAEENNQRNKLAFGSAQKQQLKSFLDGEDANMASHPFGTKPIADLFPSATVMFADIVGFTAWSSAREPTQVFTLLETVYHSFDTIAKRRRVFKVETVGDCYVAVTGLPDPRPDHAVVMARFAKECLVEMAQVSKTLEVQLGPDTGDLAMRIGIHSGPVTAGVLRGEKSRFQLFGDTVNTAARIESSGERNRIHMSEETAKLLVAGGKGHWVIQRSDFVQAKGKGALETFWLDPQLRSSPSITSGGKYNNASNNPFAEMKPRVATVDEKSQRLISWNVDVLGRLIKRVIARRNALSRLGRMRSNSVASKNEPFLSFLGTEKTDDGSSTVLDEVTEIIQLPAFDAVVIENQEEPDSIMIDEEVSEKLSKLTTTIASMYRDNPFHNFEHASHVTMSVVKLLSRIVTADALAENQKEQQEGGGAASMLHDFTFGITSDPLTQFACVFAALIHDVDHAGVPNTQLAKENTHLAKLYRNKSIAEQNSVDLSWDLFMDHEYTSLRQEICPSADDLKRFRQLVVNSVMATDIMDKDLKELRNARWDKAFSEKAPTESPAETVNRKATIVIEHLLQASDVAHTMQHWHIFRKWNERLFQELFVAFENGRAEKNPSEFWYQGELGFFDFYIIPLAKKLKDCGVFGVSSDEYLNYAEKNRREWEAKGREIVESMVQKYLQERQEELEEADPPRHPLVAESFQPRLQQTRNESKQNHDVERTII
ncbi:hypothetical protein ACA910_004617 [Epithemia clementina (nom. ined.)]